MHLQSTKANKAPMLTNEKQEDEKTQNVEP